MKKIKLFIISFTVLAFMAGCDGDFLVKSPPDSLTDDGFYNSAERALLGVNSIYQSVASEWDREILRMLVVVPGDFILSNTEPLEYNNFAYNSGIQELQFVWTNQYEGITRANLILDQVPGAEMDGDLKNRFLAEARFLRALNYFTLTNIWGGVPMITEPFEKTDDVLIAKSSVSSVYDLIISDLEFARKNLPFKSDYSNSDLGRATWGAATALLAKVYLYDENFEEAERLFDEIIDSRRYSLMENFDHVWHREYENNQESIFEIQYADIGGGGTSGLNAALLPPVHGTMFPTQRAVDGFSEDDPRLGYSIFRDGDPYAPNISDELAVFDGTSSQTGYVARKSTLPFMLINGGGTNIPLIRYADVLLMYAEVANELDMRDEARDAINEIRQRPTVDLPALTAAETGTYDDMFDAIVSERKAELFLEPHLFNDLRRWDIAEDVLGDMGYEERHRYYPIPILELDINPQLEQNPGW